MQGVGSGSFGEYLDGSLNKPSVLPAAGSKDGYKHNLGESKEQDSQSALQSDTGLEKPRTAQYTEIKQKKEADTKIFFFSRDRLAALKAAVSAALPSTPAAPAAMPGGVSQMPPHPLGQPSNGSVIDNVSHRNSVSSQAYISTNDALSALLFTCITVARSSTSTPSSSGPRAPPPNNSPRPALPHTLPLGLTLSGRRLLTLPLPKTYIGNVALVCHLKISPSQLPTSSQAKHTKPSSPMCAPPQPDDSCQPAHSSSTPGITPDFPTMASLASRIRARLLELDETYVRGLIGALHQVRDLAKVTNACRLSGIGAGAGTPILGQREDDDDKDFSSTRVAGEMA